MPRAGMPSFDPGQSRPAPSPPKPTAAPVAVTITPEFFQAILKLQPSGVTAPILIIQATAAVTAEMGAHAQALGKYLKALGVTPIIVGPDWIVEEGTDELMLALGWHRISTPASPPTAQEGP
jgi:hypothetical protein